MKPTLTLLTALLLAPLAGFYAADAPVASKPTLPNFNPGSEFADARLQ